MIDFEVYVYLKPWGTRKVIIEANTSYEAKEFAERQYGGEVMGNPQRVVHRDY